MNRIPTAKAIMTPFPHTVDAMDHVATAYAVMQQHGIRHLPVTRERKLAGILSERDIYVAGSVSGQPATGLAMPVWAICQREVYVVDLQERVDRIVAEMANRSIGSALVTRNEKLAGIVTTVDVCRAYANLIFDKFGPHNGTDVA